jgi:hypothetical protein
MYLLALLSFKPALVKDCKWSRDSVRTTAFLFAASQFTDELNSSTYFPD